MRSRCGGRCSDAAPPPAAHAAEMAIGRKLARARRLATMLLRGAMRRLSVGTVFAYTILWYVVPELVPATIRPLNECACHLAGAPHRTHTKSHCRRRSDHTAVAMRGAQLPPRRSFSHTFHSVSRAGSAGTRRGFPQSLLCASSMAIFPMCEGCPCTARALVAASMK